MNLILIDQHYILMNLILIDQHYILMNLILIDQHYILMNLILKLQIVPHCYTHNFILIIPRYINHCINNYTILILHLIRSMRIHLIIQVNHQYNIK